MYYNSNHNSDDYYNSYKKELSELDTYQKEEDLQRVLKILLSIVTLLLFLIAAFYLYKYFYPTPTNRISLFNNSQLYAQIKTQKVAEVEIKEEELPQSIQLKETLLQVTNSPTEATLNMNEKDIALIVDIIMSQMKKN